MSMIVLSCVYKTSFHVLVRDYSTSVNSASTLNLTRAHDVKSCANVE